MVFDLSTPQSLDHSDQFYLPSIGEDITFTDDGGADLAAEELPAWLACPQSLYWAQQGGVNCSGLELLYFYHSDYLGSVEFVTDNLSRLYGGMRGEPYQLARTAKLGGFFLNTPWGENIENQFARNYTAFSSRFRFNPPPLLRFRAGPLPQSRFRAGGKEWEGQALRNRPVACFSAGAGLPRWRGNYYYGARYYNPTWSVWLSVDPLATNYPYISPYNFVENNPLKFVDPTGMGPEVYIKGPDADQATQELQKKTNLTLSRDSKTGQLSASGTAKTKLDQQLLAAIESESKIVNLETTKDNSFKSRDGSTQPIRIGGYDGNEKIVEQEVIVEGIEGIMEPITMDVEKYKTTQYINMDQSAKAEKAGVSNQGSDVYHELIESYYGAIYHPGGIYNKALWNKAHNRALSDDPSAPRVQEYSNGPGQPILGLRNMLNNKRVRLP